jgi:hypothetical protein
MPFLVLLIFFLLVVALPRFVGGGRARLLKNGLEARGLVLSAARTGTQSTIGGQRFQVRSVVLDVEVVGRAPYELSINAMFPRMSEPFPGSALDLRVDPRNPNNIAIVGPAGSSGWLGATAGLFPWAASNKLASGCGTVVVVLIGASLALGAVVSFVSGSSSSSETPETPAAPTAPLVIPPSRVTPTVEPGASHKVCEEAARCCKTLARAHCAPFTSLSEGTCKGILAEETRAAAKLHKACE